MSAAPQPPKPPPKTPGTDPSGEPTPGWLKWVLIGGLLVFLYVASTWDAQETAGPPMAYSDFVARVEKGEVEKVVLRGRKVDVFMKEATEVDGKSSKRFRSNLPAQDDDALWPALRKSEVKVSVKDDSASPLSSILALALPWILILGVWFWLSRRSRGLMGAGGPFGSKPTQKRFTVESEVDVTFDDVAGLDAAKRDLREVVAFLEDPARFEALGGKMPRGILLAGPPGTGKTLLARAVAGEAGVPFFSLSGSEFIEMFVGVGAARVRSLFESARKVAPAILFIDEIDAVGRSRGTGLGGGHDEREQTLNQLLAEMDGFARDERVVVLAATNRPDVLDPALLRPGRFDRRVMAGLPEVAARRAILGVHTRKVPLDPDVDLDRWARATPGLSGADLANVVNEAVWAAFRRGSELIADVDMAAGLDKFILGEPREGRLHPDEKHRVAVHEAGHALVAHIDGTAVMRMSILPRGMALGITQPLPEEDKHLQTKSELLARLRMLMGGYAAEGAVLGEVSSGAEDDLKRATQLALRMVGQMGMSDRIGPMFYEHAREHPFLGARIATEGGVSDASIHILEEEAGTMLRQALAAAEAVVVEERERLDRLVDALMRDETLERDALRTLLEQPPPNSSQRSGPDDETSANVVSIGNSG